MKPLLDLSSKSKACCQGRLGSLEGLSVLAASPEKGNLLGAAGADQALLTVIMILHSTSATGGAIDNKIEQAMDLVKSHLLFAVREEVEVLKEQIKELLEKNEQLQRENSVLRQNQSQGLPPPHRPYSQSETTQPPLQHVGPPTATPDQGGFQSLPGPAAPRPDGYQPQPGGGEQQQFASIQAGGGPAHGQAPTQQQALPQQQAGQYGHLQPAKPPQQQHTLPQQTSTQHSQPPPQT